MLRIALALTFVLALLRTTGAVAEVNMQEGLWEMTMKAEMPGMPMEMPPVKFTQCLTKKDVVPQKREKNEDCKMTSTKIDGNTVSWAMQCRMKDGTMDSTGKITYKGNGFDGLIKSVMNTKDTGKMEMTQHMSGRRIGDCK